jgi:hypothetical protein
MALQTCTLCRRFRRGDLVISPKIPDEFGPLIVTSIHCRHGGIGTPVAGRRDLIQCTDISVSYNDFDGILVHTGLDISTVVHFDNDADIDGG